MPRLMAVVPCANACACASLGAMRASPDNREMQVMMCFMTVVFWGSLAFQCDASFAQVGHGVLGLQLAVDGVEQVLRASFMLNRQRADALVEGTLGVLHLGAAGLETAHGAVVHVGNGEHGPAGIGVGRGGQF